MFDHQHMVARLERRNPCPTVSITLTPSCPRMRPGVQVGPSPFMMCKSVPQIVVWLMFTIASVGAAMTVFHDRRAIACLDRDR
jgi:hypothetical protein